MPNTRLIALNNNAGAFTAVAVGGPFHLCLVSEDGAAAAQGIQVKFPVDNYTAIHTYTAGQGLTLTGHGYSGLLGLPTQGVAAGGNYRAADVMFQARSATGTATTIRVLEFELNQQ